MDGKFLLRKDRKPNKHGEYQVMLQYCTQGVAVKKLTGVYIHPDFWLGEVGGATLIKRGKSGHPKADIINQNLKNIKRKIDDIIDGLMTGDEKIKVMTVPLLRSILNGTYQKEVEASKGRIGFVEYVLEYNKHLYDKDKIGVSVWENIQCNMRTFKKFLQKIKHLDIDDKSTLYCRDVTVELIEDYITWRKTERNNSNETINKALTPIFKTLEKIVKEGWIFQKLCDEICELYLPSKNNSLDEPEDEEVKYLTEKQMNKLVYVTSKCKYPRTKEFVDMFLFSTYACGLRVSDVITLRWNDINMEERMIKHIQVKNHKRKTVWLNIPINDACMEILERWHGRYDNFVFGLLPSDFDLSNEENLRNAINLNSATL